MRVKRIFLFYKPYGVVSQFSPSEGAPTLKDFGPFPADVYPCGRLDADSEGLLVLTNDNALKHRLTDPSFGHPRTYCVQVEGVPDPSALERLKNGLVIEGKKTRPAEARVLAGDPGFSPRSVPIRFRKNVPTSWIEVTLREGRNRQVRKMTAALGHPTLRLVRVRVGEWTLGQMQAGEFRETAATGSSSSKEAAAPRARPEEGAPRSRRQKP